MASGVNRILLIGLLLSIRAFADSALDAKTLRDAVSVQVCKAQACWQSQFPAVAKVAPDTLDAIHAYAARMVEADALADQVVATDSEGLRAALDYRLKHARDSLKLCEELIRGGGKLQHLIIVGHSFALDGKAFREVANNLRQKKIAQLCSDKMGDARLTCESQIVVIEDFGKSDLAAFFSMFPAGSMFSEDSKEPLSYVGHGINNAIGVGGRNVLLPMQWKEDQSISREQWLAANQGMVYIDDLERDFGDSLKRVLAPNTSVSIYACKSGAQFAPALSERLNCDVHASVANMKFAWIAPNGKKHEKNAPPGSKRFLVPAFGRFEKVSRSGFGSLSDGNTTAHTSATPPKPSKVALPAFDEAAQSVTLRLINRSDSGPIWIESENRAVFFSDKERRLMNDALAQLLDLKEPSWKSNSTGYHKILETIEARMKSAAPTKAATYRTTLEKLKTCIDESVRLYYR